LPEPQRFFGLAIGLPPLAMRLQTVAI
jgi:hypothetical protein